MIKNPSDYTILKLTVDDVNLTEYFSGATFNESVFSNHMRGFATLKIYSDAYSVVNTGKMFTISYKHSGGSEIEQTFIITDIIENERNNKLVDITLVLESPNSLYFKKTISEFYNGKIGNIVEKLFNKHNKSNKKIISSDTAWQFSFVFPQWDIDRCFDFLSAKANSPTLKSFHRFFETKKGYVFKCLSDEFDKTPLITFMPMSDTANNNVEPYKYKDFRVVEKNDLIDGHDNGGISNRLVTFNPFRKQYGGVSTDSNKISGIDPVVVFKYHHDSKFKGVESSHVNDFVGKRLVERFTILDTVAEFETAGRTDFVCGDVVEVIVMSGDKPKVDRALSGKWIVVEVSDVLSDAYTQTVKVARFVE